MRAWQRCGGSKRSVTAGVTMMADALHSYCIRLAVASAMTVERLETNLHHAIVCMHACRQCVLLLGFAKCCTVWSYDGAEGSI